MLFEFFNMQRTEHKKAHFVVFNILLFHKTFVAQWSRNDRSFKIVEFEVAKSFHVCIYAMLDYRTYSLAEGVLTIQLHNYSGVHFRLE